MLDKIAQAFHPLKARPAMQFLSERHMRTKALTKAGREVDIAGVSALSELDMEDRRVLDDAVLRMLGVKNKSEREELIDRLYYFLRQFFHDVRQKEEKAIGNKNRSKRRGSISPPEIAGQIFAEIKDSNGRLLRSYKDFLDTSLPFSTIDLPPIGVAEVYEDIFAPNGSVRFMKGRKPISVLPSKTREQAELITLIATHGVRGLTRVPFDATDCDNLKRRYGAFIKDRARRFRSMIADRTGDEELQDRIFDALNELVLRESA